MPNDDDRSQPVLGLYAYADGHVTKAEDRDK